VQIFDGLFFGQFGGNAFPVVGQGTGESNQQFGFFGGVGGEHWQPASGARAFRPVPDYNRSPNLVFSGKPIVHFEHRFLF
jgi:hypothetical protein